MMRLSGRTRAEGRRVPRHLWSHALVGVLAWGVAVAGGCSDEVDDESNGNGDQSAQEGDERADREERAAAEQEEPDESPSPALPALDQPGEWDDPEMPEEPGDDAGTLEQLEYEMITQIWSAAGVRAATDVECDMTEEDLATPDDHDYECVATYDGLDVPYAVTTTTEDGTSTSVTETHFLPITREKAEHELTRQAMEPAEVSCSMEEAELVELDDPTALRCDVVDVNDESRQYHGELSANGGVFFSAT